MTILIPILLTLLIAGITYYADNRPQPKSRDHSAFSAGIGFLITGINSLLRYLVSLILMLVTWLVYFIIIYATQSQ